MTNSTKLQFLLVGAICALGGYFFGTHQVNVEWQNFKASASVVNKEPPVGAPNDFSLFWDVYDKLNREYYNKKVLDPQKEVYGAISGMVQSVGDPYTMFLPPTQNTNFQQQMAGQFSGIGAELGLAPDNKTIIIIAPLDGSPSQKAGIKEGDTILKVDGQSTAGWTLPQTVEKIRGPKGSTVTLTIVHKGSKDPQDIAIKRDTITVKSVAGWVKKIKDISAITDATKNSSQADNEIMYVRLSQFGDNTNKDWSDVVTKLKAQMQKDGNVKGAILDLRDNPGGFLTDATFIAGEFLPEGTPVVTEDDGNGNKQTLSVTRQGQLLDIPLVVLINGGSASASEIVSGALRDDRKTKLVGDKSFGKGTVQEAVDLGAGSSVHITIAKWLTPNGTWVHGKGLTPDVSVALDPKTPTVDTQLDKAIQTLLQ